MTNWLIAQQAFAGQGEHFGDNVNAQVGAMPHADNGADEGHPDKGKSRYLFRQIDPRVKKQAEYDVSKNHDEHDSDADHHQNFQRTVERLYRCVNDFNHECPPPGNQSECL